MCDANPTHAVPAHLRQRIIEHKYVDLGQLLGQARASDDEAAPTFQLIEGLLRPAHRTATRTISSFGARFLTLVALGGVGCLVATGLHLMTQALFRLDQLVSGEAIISSEC